MTRFGIGQAITRREDQRLLTGTGKYVDDTPLPGSAHIAFVRSPHAHARIVSIDASEAKTAPGVLAVITGADLKADGIGHFPINPGLKNAAGKPMTAPPMYPLAVDEARFVGEPVAAVVAASRLAARLRAPAGALRARARRGRRARRARDGVNCRTPRG